MSACGFLGKGVRAGQVVAPPRLDEQAVQAERLGVGAARHGAECALGGLAITGKLRRLRAQQQRQRLARRDAVGLRGEFARGGDIAGADRDQAAGDRLIGAYAAAVAEIARIDDGDRRWREGRPDEAKNSHRGEQRRAETISESRSAFPAR